MIRSFRGKFAQAILTERRAPKGFPADLLSIARRKLVQLNAASSLGDLVIPPGNRLEPLRGDRRGYHSIRINDQWRVVFRWSDAGPEDVDILDYH
jgi:proteic killer suppression protein